MATDGVLLVVMLLLVICVTAAVGVLWERVRRFEDRAARPSPSRVPPAPPQRREVRPRQLPQRRHGHAPGSTPRVDAYGELKEDL
ncbi:MAG: hypothetical protein ACQEXJ_20975 [Myxococcota bacterium]